MRWHTRTVRGLASIFSAKTASARLGPSLKARLPNACSKHPLSGIAVGELRLVRLERGGHGDLALRRGLGDVRGHRVDLVVRKLGRRMRACRVLPRDLARDAVGVGLERVEAGANRPRSSARRSARGNRRSPRRRRRRRPVSDAVEGSADVGVAAVGSPPPEQPARDAPRRVRRRAGMSTTRCRVSPKGTFSCYAVLPGTVGLRRVLLRRAGAGARPAATGARDWRGCVALGRRRRAGAGGVEGRTVLEPGGGIGAVEMKLLKAGAARLQTVVEMSPGYERVATDLAREAGVADRLDRHVGDFAEDGTEPADVVVLHRVVCCYPDYERLLGAAAEEGAADSRLHVPAAQRRLARCFRARINLWLRMRGTDFRDVRASTRPQWWRSSGAPASSPTRAAGEVSGAASHWHEGIGGYDRHVAVTTGAKLDAHTLRKDFPIFEQEFHGKPLAYLDSAAKLPEASPGA